MAPKRGVWLIGIAASRKPLAWVFHPVVTLGEARARRERAKKLLADGIDPSAQRKLDRVTARAGETSFRAIAEELLEKHRIEGRAQTTLDKNRWLLEVAFDAFGHRPIGQITAVELLAALRRFEERGRHESARRLRSTCGMVFKFAIATGRATRDISGDLRGALITPRVNHRAAIIEPSEIGALLRAIDGFDGHPQTKAALQIAPHVFVRPSELRCSEWSEFDFEGRVWAIPAERMKMKRPHRVPLSRQVIATLGVFAQDRRSCNQLGRDTGTDPGQISRFVRGKLDSMRSAAGRVCCAEADATETGGSDESSKCRHKPMVGPGDAWIANAGRS